MVLPDGVHEVGRASDCWLTLDDELSSRVHARLHVSLERFEVEDLGSRNGTFVNGERVEGRRVVFDGDRVRIGRELMTVFATEPATEVSESLRLRRTMAPAEQAGVFELLTQLIDKSLKVNKTRDAERYAMALFSQLSAIDISLEHPTARLGVQSLLRLAEHTGQGSWIDRLFHLHTQQRWVIARPTLDKIRDVLSRIPRIPGDGLSVYEQCLKELGREGIEVPPRLVSAVAELADAYGIRS